MDYEQGTRAESLNDEKLLSSSRVDFLKGYTRAIEDIGRLFEHTMLFPELEQILDPDIAVVNKDKAKIVRDTIADWMGIQRSNLVTGFLFLQREEEKQH